MKGQGVLTYWFDLPAEVQDEWADWYIRDHMPSRIGATFTGARCFRATTGKPQFLALYETPTPEALVSPEYTALLRSASADDRRRRAWYLHTVRGCCRKVADMGHGQGGMVATVRFSPKPAANSNELRIAIVERLAGIERVGRVALLEADPQIRARMDSARVTGHEDGVAHSVVVIECALQRDVESALTQLESMSTWHALAEPASIDSACYQLLYSIAKES